MISDSDVKEHLKSYTVAQLKKAIKDSKSNLNYSKLNKADIINLIVKNKTLFKSIMPKSRQAKLSEFGIKSKKEDKKEDKVKSMPEKKKESNRAKAMRIEKLALAQLEKDRVIGPRDTRTSNFQPSSIKIVRSRIPRPKRA
jgi:pyridoxine 5'-phosphate synthase PdxJ